MNMTLEAMKQFAKEEIEYANRRPKTIKSKKNIERNRRYSTREILEGAVA